MTETEARDSSIWQPEGGALRVVVRPRAVALMAAEALGHAARRRAGEAGGLLLGFTQPGKPSTVTIADVQPVSWPPERPDPALPVVGFYRTSRLDTLFLGAGDLALIRACFPDPANVFLLLHPGPAGGLDRRLFFWQDGVIRSDPGDGLPPWRAAEEAPLPRPRATRTLWPVAAATAATLALFFVPTRWFGPPAPPPAAAAPAAAPAPASTGESGLGLEVRKTGEGLLLRWDRSSPALLNALRAVLLIEDGARRRASELDLDELRNGSIYYTPNGGDVRFRLEVHRAAGAPQVETVQVLGAEPPREARLDPGPAAPPPAAIRAEPQRDWAAWLRHLRSLASRYTPKAPERRAAVVEDAPPQLAGSASALPPYALPAAPSSPAPPPPKPAVALDPPPARPAPAAGPWIPPKPVHQPKPELLPALRPVLRGEVVVGVRVAIDPAGKVAGAEVASYKGTPNGMLRESALGAARGWRFQPATQAGKPVPSSMLVYFRFKP